MLPTRSAKSGQEKTARKTESLRRIALLGVPPHTVRALGQLLGKRFYLLVERTEADVLSKAAAAASIDALVVGSEVLSRDSAELVKSVRSTATHRSRDGKLPIFGFGQHRGQMPPSEIENLELSGIFTRPGDVWKLAEAIHDAVDATSMKTGNGPFGIGPEAVMIGAMKYIDENLANITSSTEVSNHLGVTREHLSRQFSRYTGETLWNFITTSRIQKAVEMLRKGEALVKQVGRETGFKCESSFFRAFVKRTGVTPERFRKALQNE